MDVIGSSDWVQRARAAGRAVKSERIVATRSAPAATTQPPVPLVPSAPTGLRSLEQTQDLNVVERKGLIIDLYL